MNTGDSKYVAKTNIGHHIRMQLKKSGHSVVWLAEQLQFSRTNVYKIFEKHSISTEELMRISIILGFDFFKIYTNELDDLNG
ncbi:MAG: XRE family transcriptional regulator [Prevotellaceae bacterium]|nr:XRE family transcriptional regulator [Prevotellaceae bacterium]